MTSLDEPVKQPKNVLDLSNAVNEAFEIYKKMLLPAGFALLVVLTIFTIVCMTSIDFFIDLQKFTEEMKAFDPEKATVKANLIYVGSLTLISALISPFMAGLLKMAYAADHDEQVAFSFIGYYVNSSRFIHIVLGTSLLTLVNTGTNTFLSYFIPHYGKLLAILITVPISILTAIMIPLILFKEITFLKAIAKSVELISKKFSTVLVLLILAYLIAFVGFLAFCIGLFFTMPLIYSMQYVIYKNLAE